MRMVVIVVVLFIVIAEGASATPSARINEFDAAITRLERDGDGGESNLQKLRDHHENWSRRRPVVKERVEKLRRDVEEFLSSPAASILTQEDRHNARALVADFEELADGRRSVSSFAERWVPEEDAPVGIRQLWFGRGDVILLRSRNFWTRCMVDASLVEKRFSHVCIALSSNEVVTTGDFAGAEKMSMARVQQMAVDIAVYRYSGSDAEKVRERIARAAEKRIGTPFDPAFDLKTKDRLYCTEMVRDCVNEAAGREVIGTSRKGDFEYVAVDDCYRNEMTKVWDCRDQKPKEKQPIQKVQSRPTVIESSSTTNAPVRRIIRFIPKNGGGR